MIFRNLAKSLRGKATPPQILMATILGGMLGFIPGFALLTDLGGGFLQAPGLILSLLFLVLILNAPLGVFALATFLAKLLSLLLMPVSFEVGRVLLDGPTQGLFRTLINAPVTAWFGLEHYATTGGLLVGMLFGIAFGWLMLRAVNLFRTRMAGVESGSERYRKLTSKKSVRFATWLLVGKGKGKKTYQELLEEQRKGNPIRIVGVVAVVVIGAGLWMGHAFLSGPALRNSMQGGLESWNGATVDLEEASLDLAGGRAVLAGLGMADIEELTKNLFEARTVEMQLGTTDLLAKRLVVDTITSKEAATGAARSYPGTRIVDETAPPEPPVEPGKDKTLEDYLAEAEKWQGRLRQLSNWLENLSGDEEPAPAGETPEQREVRIAEGAEADILRQIERFPLAEVVARHLITEAPRLLVRELVLEGVTAVDLDGDLLDIRATNLSTNPALVDAPMVVSIVARSGLFSFTFRTGGGGTGRAEIETSFQGLAVDDVMAGLKGAPLAGGTMDVRFGGALDLAREGGPWVDFPLQVHLKGSTLQIQGLQPTKIDDLTVPIGVRGPLAAPAISLDDKALSDALVAAGRKELADQVRSRAAGLLDGRLPGASGALGDVISGDKTPEQLAEEAKAKLEAEAKKRAEEEKAKAEAEAQKKLQEELKKRLPGGLPGGILGGSGGGGGGGR